MAKQLPDSPDLLQSIAPVSRETVEKLEAFVALLKQWQKTRNLVGSNAMGDVWSRHIADSLQLLELGLPKGPWIDLGSGAGFPGIILAICGAGRENHIVHLVEANQGKAAFLREAVRITEAPVEIHAVRIENYVENAPAGQKTITARALAPLPELCSYLEPLLSKGSLALLPKGASFQAELTQAGRFWRMDYDIVPSRTDSQAAIVRLHGLQRKVNEN